MVKSKWAFIAMGICLAACSGGSGTPAGTVGVNGFRATDIFAPETRALGDDATQVGTIALATGGGATYRAGIDPDTGPSVSAEFLPETPTLRAPIRGEARMSGQFGLLEIANAQKVGDDWQGSVTSASGQITLTAQFGAGTLTGGGDGLAIDGQITGSRIGGLVQYNGINADLDGVIGSGSTVGVFFGGGAGRGIAGAFAASAQ